MMFTHGDVSWWWFIVMPLGMAGFWALVIWVMVTIVRGDRRDRALSSDQGHRDPTESGSLGAAARPPGPSR